MTEQQIESSDQSKKFSFSLKHKIALAIIITPFLFFLYLSTADTRNNKYAFIFQAYYFPGSIEAKAERNYTGRHRQWWKNGNPQSLKTLKDGISHGRWAEWDSAGNVIADGIYSDGKIWSGSFLLLPYTETSKWQTPLIVTFNSGVPVSAKTYEGKEFTGKIDADGNILEFSEGKFIKELGTTY